MKYLADKSALERQRHSAGARAIIATLLAENALASSHISAMEVLYSARNGDEYRRQRVSEDGLSWLPVDEAAMDRALEVQGLLAERGQHRLPIPGQDSRVEAGHRAPPPPHPDPGRLRCRRVPQQ